MSQPNENQPTPAGAPEDPVARRLARLGAIPVDTTRLDAFIRERIPRENAVRQGWLRPLTAVAAMLIAALLIGVLVLSLGDRSAVAAPAQIAQWHDQMASGAGVMTATTLQTANRMIAQSDPKAPDAPGVEGQMACCCVRRFGSSRVSCILVDRDGGRVMVCVADGDKVKIPEAATSQTRAGLTYHLMSHDGVNIVMTHRDGRWISCSGRLSHDALVETAAGLKF